MSNLAWVDNKKRSGRKEATNEKEKSLARFLNIDLPMLPLTTSQYLIATVFLDVSMVLVRYVFIDQNPRFFFVTTKMAQYGLIFGVALNKPFFCTSLGMIWQILVIWTGTIWNWLSWSIGVHGFFFGSMWKWCWIS